MISSRGRRWGERAAAVLGGAVLLGGGAGAQSMTTELVVDGLNRPAYAAAPEGDHQRLFVVELKSGLIRIVRDGAILPAPFLDLSAVISTTWQVGLFSVAFHPQYESNGYFYVYYIDLFGDSVLERYTVSAGNPDVADPTSATTVLVVLQPDEIHNGGMAAFGPDGYLYWALGDGGPQYDPNCMGQAVGSPLGKMLRIDVDRGAPYSVPASNPFVGVPGTLDEIWAIGLRNPWRFSWDAATGELFIADVGQITMEEVDVEPAGFPGGANYGWSVEEGTGCHTTSSCTGTPPCGDPVYTRPVHAYDHTGLRCAVIGGHVYRGCGVPELQGRYLFADWCTAELMSFRYVNGVAVDFQDHTAELGGGTSIVRPIAFAEDGLGETYVIDHYDGELFKIVPTAGSPLCAAKQSSAGCIPSIASTGSATLSGADDLFVHGASILGNTQGRLLWSLRPNVPPAVAGGLTPAFGASPMGTQLCVYKPRTAASLSSGGTPGACDGAFTAHLSQAFLAKTGAGPCGPLYVQWWYADPNHPDGSGAGHTGALELWIAP